MSSQLGQCPSFMYGRSNFTIAVVKLNLRCSMVTAWCYKGDWHPKPPLTIISVSLQPPTPYFEVLGERMLSSTILTPKSLQLQAFN